MHWLVHFSITNVYTCLLLHGWMDSSIHLLFLFFIFTIFSISPPTQVIIYAAEEAEDTKKKVKAHRHKEKRLAGLLLLACFCLPAFTTRPSSSLILFSHFIINSIAFLAFTALHAYTQCTQIPPFLLL